MNIPKSWAKASGECEAGAKRKMRFDVWGWGDDVSAARASAESRLGRLLDRVSRGEPIPDPYEYATRPLREEILESMDGGEGGPPAALVTRNRYGALVLNTANVLFLDVDLPPASVGQSLIRLLRRSNKPPYDAALDRLREALVQYGKATFRIYRTAAGLRAIAVDRPFDPAGAEAQELLRATGSDPAFARMCKAQKSFRARLTPKPWRCGCALPPGQFPRDEPGVASRFQDWLAKYEDASNWYATCSLLEIVGDGTASGVTVDLVALHDVMTRCTEPLPLA